MSTLTVDTIIRAMNLVRDPPPFDAVLLPPAWAKLLPLAKEPAPMFAGMRVLEAPDAKMPARVHKKRSGMSEAYHRRVQKKWNKRFGYVPAAFLLNMDALRLDFFRPFPPIYMRDLSTFSDPTARAAMYG